VPGGEGQPSHDLAGGFLRVCVADVDQRAIVVCHDGIDHRARDTAATALRVQLVRHGLPLGDQREVIAEHALEPFDLVVL
jgi:hypothetical protein